MEARRTRPKRWHPHSAFNRLQRDPFTECCKKVKGICVPQASAALTAEAFATQSGQPPNGPWTHTPIVLDRRGPPPFGGFNPPPDFVDFGPLRSELH